MFATVELNEEILTFIKYSQEHIETFDEIDVAEANINTLMSRLWKYEECGI